MFSLNVDVDFFFFFNIANFEKIKNKKDHEWLCLFYLVHIA